MNLAKLRQICESIRDWWEITLTDLDRLSLALLDRRKEGEWIRRGPERAIIAKIKFGAKAQTLPEELAALARGARQILAERKPNAPLRAAAFYHVRFENIHPLHDGNGRTGRTILAGQFYQSYGCPPAQFERELKSRAKEYKAAFTAPDARDIYRQLLIQLSQIVRMPVSTFDLDPQLSLEPLYRSEGTPTGSHLTPAQYGKQKQA